MSNADDVPGDRLLVDKLVYQFRTPRRWELAVFHCPADASKPYVKRVVGLPGEHLRIHDGDIYASGELVRKTLVETRAMLLPVVDMDYVPSTGWGQRWLMEPLREINPGKTPRQPISPRPVSKEILRDSELHLDTTTSPVGVTYCHRNLDTNDEEVIRDWHAYNGGYSSRRLRFAKPSHDGYSEPAHDFVLCCEIEVKPGNGTLSFRIFDGLDSVVADFSVGDSLISRGSKLSHEGHADRSELNPSLTLKAGTSYTLEFAFVDRVARLAIDGVEVFKPLELPAPLLHNLRKGVSRPLQLGSRGGSVILRHLQLFRDVHYLPSGVAAQGWKLGSNEFFMLGDNSSNSHDSRVWTVENQPTPGVQEHYFIGKPFLIHQPSRMGRISLNQRSRTFQMPDLTRFGLVR